MGQTKTNTVEQEYSVNTKLSHRKKFAQFFTPKPIAQIMANWILGNKKNLASVLEPAFGLGVFSRQLLTQKKEILKSKDLKLILKYLKQLENILAHSQLLN